MGRKQAQSARDAMVGTDAGTMLAKFAGHETFTLRYGWLKKAVDATLKDPGVFLRDDALVTLGVGKNMVRSIRHWGLMTAILEEDPTKPNNRGRFIRPTALGKLLFGPRGHDPYLEEPGTLWLLHWNLASAPTGPTTWFWTFNYLNDPEFTKERLIMSLGDLAEQYAWTRIADNSLQRDVDCFIRTYVSSHTSKTAVLEDSLDCPLAELGLIQQLDDSRMFSLFRAERPTLPVEVVAHAVFAFWKFWTPTRQSLSFEDLAYRPGSPGRVFQLSEEALVDYLESLAACTGDALVYDVTAGLRQLYRRREVEPLEVLNAKPVRARAC